MAQAAGPPFAASTLVRPSTTQLPAPAFSINGRFYTQPVTGVQRYAREIVREIDGLLVQQEKHASVILPPVTSGLPPFGAIESQVAGGASGHTWEQAVLPARAEAPILNLCNTGPLLARRQIVCMHDENVFVEADSYSFVFRALYRLLLPGLARRGAIVTTVSHYSARQLARHLAIEPGDITVIHNGHEHALRWDAGASFLPERMPLDRPFVLLLGSRARHKNAAFILRQAEVLDGLGLDLVVAGGSAPIFARTEMVEARNIRRLGFVTDHDLAWLYANALCLAFPSRAEGFGLPVVEAMALGCPVVSSDRTCLPEICGGAALLAGPDDAAAWQGHFQALLASSTLRADLRGRGRERAATFSWRASAQAYLDLIARL
ncbi:glycosyltransferase family 4 protein [Methylobacterium organophilum]|uniref:D-inositol-3-phosphate glycosyltransferase n=1 Tax=Methylobacterium organophilum TaxID=410 RepID=A0ABQ4TEJ5_METOR|nr:glycosyltransferase family 1 protein [Methylobacterium organophilum]GJE28447.1 D-inositol-3-phosphate glycosyltransferase [Methylobacterium organophilum]